MGENYDCCKFKVLKEKYRKMRELQKKMIPIAGVSFVIASILQLVYLIPLILTPRLIDTYIPLKDYKMIILCTMAFCGIPVLTAMGNNLYQYYLMLKSRRLIAEVNLKCFDKILHQPMKFFDENYSAELAQKSSQDAISYIAVWTIDLPKLLAGMLSGVIIFGMLCRIHFFVGIIPDLVHSNKPFSYENSGRETRKSNSEGNGI